MERIVTIALYHILFVVFLRLIKITFFLIDGSKRINLLRKSCKHVLDVRYQTATLNDELSVIFSDASFKDARERFFMISICYVPLEKREGLRLRLEGLFLCSCFFLEQDSLLFEPEVEEPRRLIIRIGKRNRKARDVGGFQHGLKG